MILIMIVTSSYFNRSLFLLLITFCLNIFFDSALIWLAWIAATPLKVNRLIYLRRISADDTQSAARILTAKLVREQWGWPAIAFRSRTDQAEAVWLSLAISDLAGRRSYRLTKVRSGKVCLPIIDTPHGYTVITRVRRIERSPGSMTPYRKQEWDHHCARTITSCDSTFSSKSATPISTTIDAKRKKKITWQKEKNKIVKSELLSVHDRWAVIDKSQEYIIIFISSD